MAYRLSTTDGKSQLILSGKFDFNSNKECRQIISEILESGSSSVVVDLRELEFIDSAGLGLLLRIDAETKKEGGSVQVLLPQGGQVLEMIEAAQFGSLMDTSG